MTPPFERYFSAIATAVQPSPIRQLVPLIKQPGVISFAGGWPDPDLFPLEEVDQIAHHVLKHEPTTALQYGGTLGEERLREVILKRLTQSYGLNAAVSQSIITTGAQQGIFLLGMMLLNPGDIVAVEGPSFTGGLGAFAAFGAQQHDFAVDEEGLRTDLLAAALEDGLEIKLVYTIPDFQNPTGTTLSLERRNHLVELAQRYDFLILEDAPYADLRYAGESLPPIYTLDDNGRTLYLGTFSKIFAPIRLGWTIGPEAIIEKMGIAKQQIDLCTPALTQAIAYHFCAQGHLEKQIEKTRTHYQRKRDVMLGALDSFMPAEASWTEPEGGMFIWMTLSEEVDTDDMLPAAVAQKLAYVPGSAFYPPRKQNIPRNSLRLNFVSPTVEQIQSGIQSLGRVVGSG